MSRLKPGEIILSNMPNKNRKANNEAKLEAAPWHARITAQTQLRESLQFFVDAGVQGVEKAYTALERNLPKGNLTKPMDAG